MIIRRETSDDITAIDEVHRTAFRLGDDPDDPLEVGLVHALRAGPAWIPALSLVAERQGAVVGHAVATRGRLGAGDAGAVALGPIGVLPDHQGAGVGGALMHSVLGAADALDLAVVVLLGHTDYYPRFGFVPASELSIEAPDPSWGSHFQARPLAVWQPAIRGQFSYPEAFADL